MFAAGRALLASRGCNFIVADELVVVLHRKAIRVSCVWANVFIKKKQVAFVYKALVAPFLTEQTRAKIKFEPAHATSRALAVDSPAAMGEGFGEESCTGSASSSDFDPAAYLVRDL